jgi:hypothetical protein
MAMQKHTSEIAAVDAMDRANFDGLTKELGPAASLPDYVHRLYVLHSATVDPHLVTPQQRTAGALFIVCRKHLVLGTLALLRLYSAQMYRESRAAVEAAGIARLIVTDMEAFRIFSSDDGSAAAAKGARTVFKSKNLFPKADKILDVLYGHYDLASRLSHTSGLTFLRHLVAGSGTGQMTFTYQDIHKESEPRCPSAFDLALPGSRQHSRIG